MTPDEMIAAAAAQLTQKWFDPATARQSIQQPQNSLDPAAQKYELRVKMLEERLDLVERILKRAGIMK